MKNQTQICWYHRHIVRDMSRQTRSQYRSHRVGITAAQECFLGYTTCYIFMIWLCVFIQYKMFPIWQIVSYPFMRCSSYTILIQFSKKNWGFSTEFLWRRVISHEWPRIHLHRARRARWRWILDHECEITLLHSNEVRNRVLSHILITKYCKK